MERASHALATEGGVWFLDPLNTAGLDDRVTELGDVRGVVVLLDRHEVGFWDGETLVVPESLGSNALSRVGEERIGLSPVSRLFPPKDLRRYDPQRVLFGHGPPVQGDPSHAIDEAVRNARRRLPGALVGAFRALV